jgi:hypothetical protein
MSDQVKVAIAAPGLTLGTAIDNGPVFHRIGPNLTSEPNSIVGVAPRNGGGRFEPVSSISRLILTRRLRQTGARVTEPGCAKAEQFQR